MELDLLFETATVRICLLWRYEWYVRARQFSREWLIVVGPVSPLKVDRANRNDNVELDEKPTDASEESNVAPLNIPASGSYQSPKIVRRKLTGYVGFANLPNQWHRRSVRKGFNFNIMVVGTFTTTCSRHERS